MVKVSFRPANKVFKAKKGEKLLGVLQDNDVSIDSNCGGEGICGKCKVIIRKGKYEHLQAAAHLTEKEIRKGYVLACQTIIKGDLELVLPFQ